jgi:hypothetical protein
MLRFLPIVFLLHSLVASSETCSYETWDWDTIKKKSVNWKSVSKNKSEINANERGEVPGCSVCAEDQTRITLPGLPVFQICRRFENAIVQSIQEALHAGFPIKSIVGYRVGKSKGPIDAQGLRTQFSNHSFGVAIDFNSENNGLYDNCASFGPSCRLLRGGGYDPQASASISPLASIYLAMMKNGFKWGGEINSQQKDFMHFSLSGF